MSTSYVYPYVLNKKLQVVALEFAMSELKNLNKEC